MSGTVNKAIVVGFVGRDPKITTTQAGKKIATFSLATNETWRDKTTGERREVSDWHNVVIFQEQLVAVVEKYVKKGSKIYIEGAMKTRPWEDKDKIKRYTTEVVLNGFHCQLTLLDRAEGRPGATSPEDYGSASRGEPARRPSAGEEMRDEIPF